MPARPLEAIIEELVKREVYPDKFSDGSAFIGAHEPSPQPFLTVTPRTDLRWHKPSRPDETYYGMREEAFAEALGQELVEDPQVALWRLAVAMHWSPQGRERGSYGNLRQAILTGRPDTIDDHAILQLLRNESVPRSPWQPFVVREISVGAWQHIAAFTRLVCTDSTNDEVIVGPAEEATIRVWSLAISLLWRAAVPDLPAEQTFATMIRTREWPRDKASLLDTSLRAKTESSSNSSLATKIVWLALPADEAHAQLAWATRSLLLSLWAEPHSDLEYILQLLRFHLNPSRKGKSETYAHKWPKNSANAHPLHRNHELHSVVRFLQHLQGCTSHPWGLEAESHRVRAVEAAHHMGDWLPALAPWVIRAFAPDTEEAVAGIMAEIATDHVLDRLADMIDDHAEESLQTSGCIADAILRRCGRLARTLDPADFRELIGPFEPIRGQTWLNDQRIEHILYEAVRTAEGKFSQYYTDAHREHEDYLLRDLLDEHVRPALAQAVREANRIVNRTADRWGLHWSKLQATEERNVGADLALVVEIRAPQRIELRRVALLQVKAMRRRRDRFSSAWRIDREQLKDIRAATDSSFYLLLTPHILSAQQRVLRADTVHGILEATAKKETLSDASAGPHAHSLAQFLVYDLLGAWQGSEQRRVLDWLENRDGVAPRYILTIRLLRGEGANVDIS